MAPPRSLRWAPPRILSTDASMLPPEEDMSASSKARSFKTRQLPSQNQLTPANRNSRNKVKAVKDHSTNQATAQSKTSLRQQFDSVRNPSDCVYGSPQTKIENPHGMHCVRRSLGSLDSSFQSSTQCRILNMSIIHNSITFQFLASSESNSWR